jgi:hypothetical protein
VAKVAEREEETGDLESSLEGKDSSIHLKSGL